MATLNDIVAGAAEDLSLTVGGGSLTASDQAVILSCLQDVLARLPEYGAGRKLVERTTEASITLAEDQRVICVVSGLTITLPDSPRDGARASVIPITGTATVTPTCRKIEGSAASVTVSLPTVWAYRADLADWVKVTALVGADDSPWPGECDSALRHITAKMAAPKFEAQIGAELAVQIIEDETFLRAKYARPGNVDFSQVLPRSVLGPGRKYYN